MNSIGCRARRGVRRAVRPGAPRDRGAPEPGSATLGELAEPFAISLQAVSKHISVLEDAGLVWRTREAQRRPVHLDAAALERLTSWIDRYRLEAEVGLPPARRGAGGIRDRRSTPQTRSPPKEGRNHEQSRRHRCDSRPVVRRHHARIRGARRRGLPRARRPRAVQDLDRPAQREDASSPTGTSARGGGYRFEQTEGDGKTYAFRGVFHTVSARTS